MSYLSEGCGSQTSVVIGGLPINIQSADSEFIGMLERRYAGFVAKPAAAGIRLDVEVVAAVGDKADEDLEVRYANEHWTINRGDFRAQWDPVSMRGCVRQGAYPYAIDSVMRIVHSLVLAQNGGFLVHSASAVRRRESVSLFSEYRARARPRFRAWRRLTSRCSPTKSRTYAARANPTKRAALPSPATSARPAKTFPRPSRRCTCLFKGGTIMRAGSEGQTRRDGCCVIFCSLPTMRNGSNGCFARPASSYRGFQFTN